MHTYIHMVPAMYGYVPEATSVQVTCSSAIPALQIQDIFYDPEMPSGRGLNIIVGNEVLGYCMVALLYTLTSNLGMYLGPYNTSLSKPEARCLPPRACCTVYWALKFGTWQRPVRLCQEDGNTWKMKS